MNLYLFPWTSCDSYYIRDPHTHPTQSGSGEGNTNSSVVIRAAMQGLTSKGLDQQKIIVQFHVPNTNLTFMTGIVVESKKRFELEENWGQKSTL